MLQQFCTRYDISNKQKREVLLYLYLYTAQPQKRKDKIRHILEEVFTIQFTITGLLIDRKEDVYDDITKSLEGFGTHRKDLAIHNYDKNKEYFDNWIDGTAVSYGS